MERKAQSIGAGALPVHPVPSAPPFVHCNSGMLPGYISGFYTFDDVHIDLSLLARFAGTRLVHAECTGLDLQGQRVLLRGRPPLRYDVLSLNLGITPTLSSVPGAAQHSTPVKPISG